MFYSKDNMRVKTNDLFTQTLQPMASDPLLGLSAIYIDDNNPLKVDLGVGVYKNDSGLAPVLQSVKQAELLHISQEETKAYIDPKGDAEYLSAIETLLLGSSHGVIKDKRIRSIQTPGGSCALRIASEFIQRCHSSATLWLSDPTWVNHDSLMGRVGLQIKQYRYYDYATHSLDFAGLVSSLQQVRPKDVVLFHGCCHNPTGEDFSLAQWQEIAELALQKGFIPLVDIAYQGLGQGLDVDAAGLRLLAEQLPEVLVTASCSKNFAIYRERTGSFSVISSSSLAAEAAQSHVLDIIRGYYFVPPTHGGNIVKTILGDPRLSSLWQQELEAIRLRIHEMRVLLSMHFSASDFEGRFSHLAQQQGMFSFLGLSPSQVERLRQEFSVYMASSSRINLSGINTKNVTYLVDAIIAVLKG